MRRILKWLGGGLLVAVVALAAYVRLAPSDPAVWHADPLTVVRASAANSFLSAPEGVAAAAPDQSGPAFAAPPREILAAFDEIALAAPRTSRLAGSPEEGWATYVQRSRLMGYPDYISVRAVSLDGGRSALAVYSRSRFGQGDWGVNRARVTAWLEEVDRRVD